MSNILKRKNEDGDNSSDDQLNKRVALDSEQLESEKSTPQESPKTEAHSDNGGSESHDSKVNTESTENIPVKPELAEVHKSGDYGLAADAQTNGASPESSPSRDSYVPSETYTHAPVAKPVSSHREKEDPDHLSVRMLCPVKEAGVIVGKKGEKITHIREKANVRIYVSENIKGVPERVISVKGSAENVARAFGLITRTILDEPEDEPASMLSKQYILKLLVPHPIVGYVIGKSGSKFREIEENSAAKLKAAEQPLPYSTDRVLTVSGVGDAIHIAIYYICQVLLEHREALKKHKVVFYNPGAVPQPSNPMMNMGVPQHNGMPYMNTPMQMNTHGMAPVGIPPMKDHVQPYQKPYDFQMMFQPAVRPQCNGPSNIPATAIPPQSSYTDEHGNTIVGDVITNMPVQISTAPDRFTQDVFVANINIGSVIGKGGHNIKQIRESSGCTYVKIEPDQHQSILLGGGKGLTNIRKLTLTGTYTAIQTAIFFINQRISADKERNGIQ